MNAASGSADCSMRPATRGARRMTAVGAVAASAGISAERFAR
ncbi:hypothetical protein [Streptomyces sp. NPDC058335]